MRGHYDRNGERMDAVELATNERSNWEGTRVLFNRLDSCEVSTEHLGLNHRWGDGPPLIFETMIFGGDFNEHTWRWTTEEAAARGHLAILDALREGRSPDQVEREGGKNA